MATCHIHGSCSSRREKSSTAHAAEYEFCLNCIHHCCFPQFVPHPFRLTLNHSTALARMSSRIAGLSIQMKMRLIRPPNALQASEQLRNQPLPRQRFVLYNPPFFFLVSFTHRQGLKLFFATPTNGG